MPTNNIDDLAGLSTRMQLQERRKELRTASSILIKRALRVVVMNPSRDEMEDCDVLVEGNAIKKVGRNLRARARRTLDARNCVVLPGFVNTHHHLYQTLTRNIPSVQDVKLFDWLGCLYEVWRHLTPEAVYVSAQAGLGELLLTGCTTTADQFYVFPKGSSPELIDREIEAAKELGIRFHPCRGSMSRGRSKGGLPPDDVVQSEEDILKDCERVVKRYHDPAPLSMCRIALAPCSPFSVTEELLRSTAAAAREWGVRIHTHLAETQDEESYCRERYKMSPLEFMESVGWLNGSAWFAHCVHMDDAQAEILARTSTGVAHCPSSNLRLGSGIAPVRLFLDKGVNVGLAVDGSASNDSSDMLGELRQCLLIHRIKSGVGSMPAREVLKMATEGGARVLGRDDIGSLEPGKAADIAIFDLNKIDYAGALHDPVAALLFAGAGHRAKWVVVNGRIAVENGNLVGLDESKIFRKAGRIAAQMVQ